MSDGQATPTSSGISPHVPSCHSVDAGTYHNQASHLMEKKETNLQHLMKPTTTTRTETWKDACVTSYI
jgi:hypothetical protein